MNSLNRFVVGCECNRSTLDTIQDAGFEVTQVERSMAKKVPPFVRPLIAGSAKTIAGRRYAEQLSTTQPQRR